MAYRRQPSLIDTFRAGCHITNTTLAIVSEPPKKGRKTFKNGIQMYLRFDFGISSADIYHHVITWWVKGTDQLDKLQFKFGIMSFSLFIRAPVDSVKWWRNRIGESLRSYNCYMGMYNLQSLHRYNILLYEVVWSVEGVNVCILKAKLFIRTYTVWFLSWIQYKWELKIRNF